MKKAAIILMGICLCLSIPVAAEAAQTGISSVTQQSTINTTVPDTHMVTIRSEHAQVSYQHEEGDDDETQETLSLIHIWKMRETGWKSIIVCW